jgi:UDP-galactopyranose mutase
MLNKSKVQEEFHNYGIQISRTTVKSINDFIYKLVEFTIQKAIDNNVKRITRDNLNNLIALKDIDQIVDFNTTSAENND